MRYLFKITSALFGLFIVTAPLQSQAAVPTYWANITPPNATAAALLSWLNKGGYKENFIPEPVKHSSNSGGAHDPVVRTYYNPILASDLFNKKKVFRRGAAMVKELYTGNKVTGYAVMIKTLKHTTSQGQDWLFYETLDKTGQDATFGNGVDNCVGCHQKGVDFLRSTFRPYK